MSRFKSIRNKINKKSSMSIEEKLASLNKELEKTGMTNVSEMMTTDSVYSSSENVPAVPAIESPIPDPGGDTGITTPNWQQPLGNGADGDPASAAPTSFPKIWNNAGYLDPTDGLLNKSDLNGDGADLPLFDTDQLDWTVPNEDIPAGAVNGVQIEIGGTDPGIVAGYLSADGFTRTTGQNVRLGTFTFKTHPDQFKPVNYWVPFSIFNPFIDAYWPNNSLGLTPQYQGIVKGSEDNAPMALFTAYVYTGGRKTYESQQAQPETTKNPIRRGLEDEPIYPGPIENLFGLGKRGLDWLKEKAEEALDNIKDTFGYRTEIAISVMNDEEFVRTNEEVTDREKEDLTSGLDPDEVPINNEETGYSDERFYENENGQIIKKKKNPLDDIDITEPNWQEKITPEVQREYNEWAKENEEHPDNTDFVSKVQNEKAEGEKVTAGEVGGLAGRGKAHHEFVDPTGNANDAYYHYKDYAYASSDSKDPVEFPNPTDAAAAAAASAASGGSNIKDKYGENITGMSIVEVKVPYSQWTQEMKNSYHNRTKTKPPTTNESYITEGVGLGHFEPDQLNVDIKDLRKGIMPEYPKKPPAEMIDGYHEKSRIRSKEAKNEEPFVKVDRADLIRNHRLKKSEADEMMKTIDMINAHIKAHPEDYIHAQQRYPVDDPRLAELNYKMDMMLEAGEEYLDSNFKENKKLFKRATERTQKNIKLTDPKYVQQKYDELRGTTKPKKTKLVGRLGKHLNKYESKSLFKHVNSKNFKKINEQKMERKEQVKQIQKEIKIEFQERKNDWRKDLSNNTH